MNVFKRKRLLQELTQWEVYRKTGITPGRISLIEREMVEPKPEEKELLTRVLIRGEESGNELT